MKTVPFYANDFTINVHSSTVAKLVNKKVNIEQFNKATGDVKGSLYEMGGNEFMYRGVSGEWIQGDLV